MATVIVHDVDGAALERLRLAVESQGRSVEAEVRAFIEERSRISETERPEAAASGDLHAYREELRAKYGTFPDTTEWIRQDRAAW